MFFEGGKDEDDLAAVVDDVEDRDDARMGQVAEDLRFPAELAGAPRSSEAQSR
jgi:hypothetical protein